MTTLPVQAQCWDRALQQEVSHLVAFTQSCLEPWLQSQNRVCAVYEEYTLLLEQRGLTSQPIGYEASTDAQGLIARPDLFFRAYQTVCAQSGQPGSFTSLPYFISTGTCFWLLHHLNVRHQAAIRGEVNQEYNALLREAPQCGYNVIPGDNLHDLDVSGWNECCPAAAVHPDLYLQAMGSVLRKYDTLRTTQTLARQQLACVSNASIHDCPPEVLDIIFTRLALPDLARATCVCRQWQTGCNVVWARPLSSPIIEWFACDRIADAFIDAVIEEEEKTFTEETVKKFLQGMYKWLDFHVQVRQLRRNSWERSLPHLNVDHINCQLPQWVLNTEDDIQAALFSEVDREADTSRTQLVAQHQAMIQLYKDSEARFQRHADMCQLSLTPLTKSVLRSLHQVAEELSKHEIYRKRKEEHKERADWEFRNRYP